MEWMCRETYRGSHRQTNPKLSLPLLTTKLPYMDPLFLFLGILSSLSLAVLVSSSHLTEFAYPNFTASNINYVDASGSFLFSRNGTFKAAMFNPGAQQTRFYLCIIHVQSNTLVWSANRDSPVSQSGIMSLTGKGISIISEDGGSVSWSTRQFSSSVSALQLKENGNLVLLDASNSTLWDSFSNPTDTIVIGQRLPVGAELSGAVSVDDLSRGHYRLALTASDATLRWQGRTYWKLSMDTNAYVNSNYAAEYMEINKTGLYLFGRNGSAIVVQVTLPRAEFLTAKVDDSGQLIVSSYVGAIQNSEFVAPGDECRIPFICGKIGLCSIGISKDSPVCSCPLTFRMISDNTCVPADSSYLLPISCNSSDDDSSSNISDLSYLQLGYGVDYFANDFKMPARHGVNLSLCQDLCSGDCRCLGVFYENSSGACHIIEDELGSVMLRSSSNGRLGFIKTFIRPPPTNFSGLDNDAVDFPVVAVILPICGILFLFVIGILLWRRYRHSNIRKESLTFPNSPYSEDLEFCIPGLPLRFEYEELKYATANFKTQIGTGGFGTVFKGILLDKTIVAVKKISNMGIRGKKDFCAEIAIIGSIHHVNLVKLKGYCAQKRQWLLVYEYMNRGSLDKIVFGNVEPVLEWQERVEIAIGAARGLAYLHSGCERKIIHCDIKPENILLHGNFQAKISDFGLSKLLTREQSCLITTMRGTRGYLAPEWLTSSAISDKTDVYSFGMVLLEIVSGRRNCSLRKHSQSLGGNNSDGGNSTSPADQQQQRLVYFPLYALEMHQRGKYLELVDPRLGGRVTNGDVEKLVRVALCCVQEEPTLRPTMVGVVGMLEGEIPLGNPIIESLNFLRFLGRTY